MPPNLVTAIGDQSPKPRILQHLGRRYSIRLEPIFWQSLDSLAARQGMRLGRFVAERAETYRGANFASYLRVICMLDAGQALAHATLRPSQGSLIDLVTGCTSPGLVLTRHRTIVAYNGGLEQWLGPAHKPLAGAELTSIMQIRTRRPLNEIWEEMLDGKLARADINVLNVEPGRVVAANARLLALHAPEEDAFYAVLWLSSGARTVSPPPPR
ncbi:MAG: ribbon-helix-helix domain-containing protein [Alphaproteobacteria bacterium]